MASKTIEPKEEYHELTDKMKAIVDAIVENPDSIQAEQAEIASEKIDGDNVSRSYVAVVKNTYDNIIQDRRHKIENKRYEGKVSTEGDPFDGQLDEAVSGESEKSDDDPYAGQLDDDQGWQMISERPVQGSVDDSDEESVEVETDEEDYEIVDGEYQVVDEDDAESPDVDQEGVEVNQESVDNVSQRARSIGLEIEIDVDDVEDLMAGKVPDKFKSNLLGNLIDKSFERK